jgi:hypothetical protein
MENVECPQALIVRPIMRTCDLVSKIKGVEIGLFVESPLKCRTPYRVGSIGLPFWSGLVTRIYDRLDVAAWKLLLQCDPCAA